MNYYGVTAQPCESIQSLNTFITDLKAPIWAYQMSCSQ